MIIVEAFISSLFFTLENKELIFGEPPLPERQEDEYPFNFYTVVAYKGGTCIIYDDEPPED